MLPGDPGFSDILHSSLPPGSTAQYYVLSERGVLEAATPERLDEYLGGGEYDEVTQGEDFEECP